MLTEPGKLSNSFNCVSHSRSQQSYIAVTMFMLRVYHIDIESSFHN